MHRTLFLLDILAATVIAAAIVFVLAVICITVTTALRHIIR